jgi:hypothetical protein
MIEPAWLSYSQWQNRSFHSLSEAQNIKKKTAKRDYNRKLIVIRVIRDAFQYIFNGKNFFAFLV